MWQCFRRWARGEGDQTPTAYFGAVYFKPLQAICTQQGHIQCLLTADYLIGYLPRQSCATVRPGPL